MRVNDGQVAALRAFLVHDSDSTVSLTAQLGDEGMPGYQCLVDAALSVVAGRRFSSRFTSADLVRYVASVRVSRMVDGDEYDFDPCVGEHVLRYALGRNIRITPNPEERFRAVIALLGALAGGELSSEEDVDDLLAEAGGLADRWAVNDQPMH